MLPRILAIVTLASLCLLSLLVTTTSPNVAGPFGLLAVFITAYLACVGLISFFLFGLNRSLVAIATAMDVRRPLKPMSLRRAYYFSTVLAAAPVMLVGLQSVRSISIYEFVLVAAFEVVACIYVSRRTA